MRTLLGIVAGAAIATASLRPTTIPLAPIVLAQAAWPDTADPRYTTVGWDAPTQRTDGSPLEAVAGYKLAYWPVGADIQAVAPIASADVSGTTTTLAPLVSEDTAEGEYQISVRAVDADGLLSAWAEPIVLNWKIEQQPPAPVARWRITLVGRSDGTVVWEETP